LGVLKPKFLQSPGKVGLAELQADNGQAVKQTAGSVHPNDPGVTTIRFTSEFR
jgi:hypothetical protein